MKYLQATIGVKKPTILKSFRPLFIKSKENHPFKTPKSEFFYAILPIDNVLQMSVSETDGYDFEKMLSLNGSKFATECHWNSKSLKTYRNWVFSKEKMALLEKVWVFFNIGKGVKFAEECTSNSIVSWKCLFYLNCVFFLKNRIFSFGKIWKFMKKEYLMERNRFLILKKTW